MPQTQTLYLMLGYPGAGKTTTAKAISDLTGAVHLWADKIRNERYDNPTHSHQENLELYTYMNELTAELLDGGNSVVFDTNFNFYKDRQYLREIAARYGATTKLVWVQTKKEIARVRATNDKHAKANTYPAAMPLERFERITHELETPGPDEPYIAVDGTKVTKKYIAALLGLS